jgi:putative polyhydroxyalkanoate system protein
MSEILITRKHRLSAKKAKAAAEHVALDLQKEYELEYEWDEDGVLRFERLGLHGELRLAKGEVTVLVHLGFLLWPFRASLEREIHAYFDERFA